MSSDYSLYLNSISIFGKVYKKFIINHKINKYITNTALDYGCGTNGLNSLRNDIIGVDINKEIIKYCISKGRKAILINDKIPFKDNSFQTIIMDNVLEHIANPDSTISELKRVLNKNGKIIIGLPGYKGFLHDPDHKRFYSEEDIIKLMNNFYFDLDEMYYTPLFQSNFLNLNLRQYCMYSIWTNLKNTSGN